MMPIDNFKEKNRGKIVIGITGGAGSGKSTIVDKVLSEFDCEFIHCDEVAHTLMEPGGVNYKALIKEYGKGILQEGSDAISRPLLTKAAAESEKGFARLNEITHPNVIKHSKATIKKTKKKIVLIEAALLLEAGMDSVCDEVWYIYAPIDDRIRRMKASRGYTDEKINTLLKNQLTEEQFREKCGFVIDNGDGCNDGGDKAISRLNTLLDCIAKK